MTDRKINIAVFASGSGTNAENLFHFFNDNEDAVVSLIVCNNVGAYVLERANRLGIQTLVIDRECMLSPEGLINKLINREIDLIVLAGFLWLIPEALVKAFPNRILNIHPALLPKYGGKGMYGLRVHEAVHQSLENETGITIHYVNNQYDEGDIIFQATVTIDPATETPAGIADKVHELEHEWYPKIVERVVHRLKISE